MSLELKTINSLIKNQFVPLFRRVKGVFFNHSTNYILFLLLTFLTLTTTAQTIKVACVGNSVTFGAGIENRAKNSYPSQLQLMLGETYQVENFGFNGATLLKKGHKPYWEKEQFKKSQDFQPNIVIIHLGLNDQGNNNWPNHKDEFIANYLEMISVYQNLPSKPKVIICKMTPTFSGHHWFEEGMRENFKEIQAQIEIISDSSKVQLIDLHKKLYLFPEYFPDNLHPTKKGAALIAKQAYSAITGDFGGLQLPLLYGEKMVLQRNKPIEISGTSNANDDIKISFNGKKRLVQVSDNGKWHAIFPSMKAGGPHKLLIKSKLSEDITINEVYIGEVWLASGQSNMDWRVNQSKHAKTVLKDSLNDQIFLFSLDPKVLKDGAFTVKEQELINAEDYFKGSGWSHTNFEAIENFSAVAYAFAFNLQKELNIPIGIVCNAVGGAPTQSYISRCTMEKDHQTIDLLNDTWLNPMLDVWVANRIVNNSVDKNKMGVRHPYEPTILFDAGINPIKNFPFKGVIWYQGESNADQLVLHEKLFKMLIKDWRNQFQNPELPFYYVQLSSMERPGWEFFRDSQRRLLSIPYTGMAVSSDVGNRTDVHPKQKWVVGKRLSNIALAKTYGLNIAYSGPLLDYVNIIDNKLTVHFQFGEGLKTTDDNPVKDIEIAGADKVFKSAKSTIKKNVLEVWHPEINNPRFIRYGYSPFTEGNLTNKSGLPASTFSNLTGL
ncbi:sialate O-acetylesterase [Aureibaculum algae]|uniref:Sialate O-acetylesterase n=1 Tax=Aureibaculum algae TaxID=2584122 RepID=A0A5B7TNW4_9FLAO|nr:GDSL-type esterase/lipase family protein [Aureibaculum algae]QCX38609.1 sialate O-acetylesterase [Aureibaculum algae]